jgi:hypothetical protein
MKLEDILALGNVFKLVVNFVEKNIIRKKKVNFNKIKEKIHRLESIKEEEKQLKQYKSILRRLHSIIKNDLLIDTYFIVGGHGGIIIKDIGFCEFDSPKSAIDALLRKMNLAVETGMPYHLEIAVSSLEWLNEKYPDKIREFLRIFKLGKFEIINPTFSQPYNLIIGPESNIKQFEYGLKELKKLGLDSNIYYCSESSIHPQIPQILKGFNIDYSSLRTRLLGVNPTSNSAYINWIGLDNTVIDTIVDQSGVFNGEYWHGTFFKEIPNLLFQAVSRPFMKYIIYSNIEDFRNPEPYQEEVWRISKTSEIFGRFLQCSEFFKLFEQNGEYKYHRDEFLLGDYVLLPYELFLQNKNSEILLLSAEFINFILGFFNTNSNDRLFEDLWKDLLLTQAHDCYAVPFIRSGDYTQMQLGNGEFENLEKNSVNITISDLSIQIHKEIQKKCRNFIIQSLSFIANELAHKSNGSEQFPKSYLVFNPTPYTRNDVISIYSNQDLILKTIESIPGFSYKILSYPEEFKQEIKNQSSFFYKIEILDDLNTIQVKYNKKNVFVLKFNTKQAYELYLEDQFKDDIEERSIIIGMSKNQAFKIELIQYRTINRLEFLIDSHSLQEIILTPKFKIEKSIINYPFGIEETKRSKIQTLDFIWLKGSIQGIIYIEKNSQNFKINRESFEIRNLISSKGRYEFAISITDENSSISPIFYVKSYYHKFFGVILEENLHFTRNTDTFLSIVPSISVINLWRRKNGSFLRLFNPNNEEQTIKLSGKLVKSQIKELDFNYKVLSSLKSDKVEIKPWKIKTLKL